MKTITFRMLSLASTVLLLTMLFAAPAFAQDKLQDNPGGYHGELDFPISWKQYYTYAEWTKIMHDLQAKYPEISTIESIGQSRMGREMYLLTITTKSTGGELSKPAMWVEGAVHGNEVNGVMCSLYLAWYLTTRYDYDQYVHDLVDNTTFYVLPGVNVDAIDSFVAFPNNPNNPREPYRPEDNDGDGLYDEDQTEDVDGDGQLSTMYLVDPEGNMKLSDDGRRFVNITDPNEKVMRFRRIGTEGYDNDGDGRINEDDIGGPDPNRNYPFGFSLGAGETYPLSEPETRNCIEFGLKHPNIIGSFHYHNTGRLIMTVTPPRAPNPAPAGNSAMQQTSNLQLDQMLQLNSGAVQYQVQQAQRQRGQRQQAPPTQQQRQRGQQQQQTQGTEEVQELSEFQQQLAAAQAVNKYAHMFDIDVAEGYEEDLNAINKIVSGGNRILRNYRPTGAGGNGMGPASFYGMFGAYSILIELWGSPTFDIDMNDDGRSTQEETMAWIDYDLTGEGWVIPHQAEHPDFGEVWIGGTQKKHTVRTPPSKYIEMECYKNAHFVMYQASQYPKVEIDKVEITPAMDDLCWVEVTVKNDRAYPTYTDRAMVLGRAVQDKLILETSAGVSIVQLPQRATAAVAGGGQRGGARGGRGGGGVDLKKEAYQWVTDYYNGVNSGTTLTASEHEFRLKGNDSQTFRYLVKINGSRGSVTSRIVSKNGGTDEQRIRINISNN